MIPELPSGSYASFYCAGGVRVTARRPNGVWTARGRGTSRSPNRGSLLPPAAPIGDVVSREETT